MTTVINSRICVSCGNRKPLSEFNRKSQDKLTYELTCKTCQKEKMLSDTPDRDSDFITRQKERDTFPHITTAATPQDVEFPEKETPNKTFSRISVATELLNTQEILDNIKTEKELTDTSTPLESPFPEKTNLNKVQTKISEAIEPIDLVEDVNNIKTEKELIDTSTPLESPFPEKSTPNKTKRKIRV